MARFGNRTGACGVVFVFGTTSAIAQDQVSTEAAMAVGGILGLLTAVIIGAISGWVAGLIVTGTGSGLLGNIAAGIGGSFLSGYLLPLLGLSFGGAIGGLISAVIGAVVLILMVRLIRKAANQEHHALAVAKPGDPPNVRVLMEDVARGDRRWDVFFSVSSASSSAGSVALFSEGRSWVARPREWALPLA